MLVAFATTLGAAVPTGYCIGVINSPSEVSLCSDNIQLFYIDDFIALSLQLMKVWCNQTIQEKYGSTLSTSGLEIFWSSVVSIFLVGGAIGSLGGAGFANRFGRFVCSKY